MSAVIQRVKTALRQTLPDPVVHKYRILRYGRTWLDPKGRSAAKLFSEIYRQGLWGTTDAMQPFNSGPGSRAELAAPYVAAVQALIDEHHIESVVDLGCGDFRVGRVLVRRDFHYCGVDVVKELVDYNNERFASDRVRFQQADLLTDELPDAELCLIRQVLQHLSNAEVETILARCTRYPFVVVTDHLPDPATPFVANVDIEHGNETRVDRGSGLVLDAAPFHVKIERTLCEVKLEDGTVLRSVLIVNREPREPSRV